MKYKPISTKVLAFSTLIAVRKTLTASLISFVLLHPSMVHAQDSLSDSSGVGAYDLSDFSGTSLDDQIAYIESIGGEVVATLPCIPGQQCIIDPPPHPCHRPVDTAHIIIVLLNDQYYLVDSKNQYSVLSDDQYSQLLNDQYYLVDSENHYSVLSGDSTDSTLCYSSPI